MHIDPQSGCCMPRRRALGVALAGTLGMAAARAQWRVEVAGVGVRQYPVAILPLQGQHVAPQAVSSIVWADLLRSGLFREVAAGAQEAPLSPQPDMAALRAAGADYVTTGSLRRTGPQHWTLGFALWDAVQGQNLGGQTHSVPTADLRLAAHRMADWVYEKITSERGVFATRLAYITRNAARYTLWVCDADGQNAQAALSSTQPIMSPAWSPDGARLAYVSFELRKPVVYVHDVRSGQRTAVAQFRGSNSAPAWSPDGRHLVVTLSRDGGSQLYRIAATGGAPQRLTHSNAIDTEAAWSPDGASLYFVSDRGGSPQIYRMPAAAGNAQRISFAGNYNISPAPSPNGKSLAFIARTPDGFRLAVMDLASGSISMPTQSRTDEHPSFAPNSRILVYATGNALMCTSVDGLVSTRLSARAGEIREPAWGPWT